MHVLPERDEETLEIFGTLLGFGSSKRDEHNHPVPPDGEIRTAPDDRCSACRWFEVRIFEVLGEYSPDCTCGVGDDDPEAEHSMKCGLQAPRAQFLVLTYGQTVVPGELVKRRASWTDSGYEVIELLTQRQGVRRSFLPNASARALAQASELNERIRSAYVRRRPL